MENLVNRVLSLSAPEQIGVISFALLFILVVIAMIGMMIKMLKSYFANTAHQTKVVQNRMKSDIEAESFLEKSDGIKDALVGFLVLILLWTGYAFLPQIAFVIQF